MLSDPDDCVVSMVGPAISLPPAPIELLLSSPLPLPVESLEDARRTVSAAVAAAVAVELLLLCRCAVLLLDGGFDVVCGSPHSVDVDDDVEEDVFVLGDVADDGVDEGAIGDIRKRSLFTELERINSGAVFNGLPTAPLTLSCATEFGRAESRSISYGPDDDDVDEQDAGDVEAVVADAWGDDAVAGGDGVDDNVIGSCFF